MPLQQRNMWCVTFLGLTFANWTCADVSTINSAVLSPRVFNDTPGSLFTGVNNYPSSIVLSESGVSSPTGFANRDMWHFSNNGTTAYQFQENDYFFASFDLTLTADPASPRKEAGFLLSSTSSGDIQFTVNTDGHEVIQFGGISFYSFNLFDGLTYTSGQTITLGMKYFLDDNSVNALQFFADSYATPVFEFGPSVGAGATGIGNGSVLGAYFQILNDPGNPNNGGTAVFNNIILIPEPSLVVLGLGATPLLLRRRHRRS